MLPARLPVTTFDHFYRGGERIRNLRGGPARGERTPEEWLGSVTARFGAAPLGLTPLPDGELLRDAIARDPEAWLGEDHLARFGQEVGVLVKLLDAGERLPVHLHPSREFARRHLSCPYGKTESWLVLEADAGASVHLGFAEPVERELLDRLVADQDVDGLLGRMHEVAVRAGDAVLVPAGMPHAIGEGLLILEVQEPSDFSILLEWQGFDLDGPKEGHLGLGFDLALSAVGGPVSRAGVKALHRRGVLGQQPADRLLPTLPPGADEFFRAELAAPVSEVALPAGFGVLVCVEGSGELTVEGEEPVALSRGDVLAVPHAAGAVRLSGALRAVLCRAAATPPVTS